MGTNDNDVVLSIARFLKDFLQRFTEADLCSNFLILKEALLFNQVLFRLICPVSISNYTEQRS